ncbi:MAG: hypothetical protein LBK65_08975 [Tannerellaceae bacterium]|nr:hypothetical protein [Tannerellaceae bacterium]
MVTQIGRLPASETGNPVKAKGADRALRRRHTGKAGGLNLWVIGKPEGAARSTIPHHGTAAQFNFRHDKEQRAPFSGFTRRKRRPPRKTQIFTC